MRLKAASLAQINHRPTPALASVLPVLVENFAVHNGDCQKQNNAAKSFAFQQHLSSFLQNSNHHMKVYVKATMLRFPFSNTQTITLVYKQPKKIRFLLLQWYAVQSHRQKVTKSQRGSAIQKLEFQKDLPSVQNPPHSQHFSSESRNGQEEGNMKFYTFCVGM